MNYLTSLVQDFTDKKNLNLSQVQKACVQQLDGDVLALFDQLNMPDPLNAAARYAMSNGGKRVRPLLALCTYFSVCKNPTNQSLDMLRRAMMAVEFIHGYSLVHDDLPCMDDDALRRGKPTCHVVYGEASALLAGDVMQSLAFLSLSGEVAGFGGDKEVMSKLTSVLSMGAFKMVVGQQQDLSGEQKQLTQEALEKIHQDKTGALIVSAVLMGGICAGASEEELMGLEQFARAMGLAFQVQDDVLDVVADTETLGKPAGSDEKLQKSTYVRLLGVDKANDYANELYKNAHTAVIGFGDQNLLVQMIDWLKNRTH